MGLLGACAWLSQAYPGAIGSCMSFCSSSWSLPSPLHSFPWAAPLFHLWWRDRSSVLFVSYIAFKVGSFQVRYVCSCCSLHKKRRDGWNAEFTWICAKAWCRMVASVVTSYMYEFSWNSELTRWEQAWMEQASYSLFCHLLERPNDGPLIPDLWYLSRALH